MSATILVGDIEATILDGVWRSKNKLFAGLCENISHELFPTQYEPDPDLAAANRVIAALGGTVVKSDTPKSRAGRIY